MWIKHGIELIKSSDKNRILIQKHGRDLLEIWIKEAKIVLSGKLGKCDKKIIKDLGFGDLL